MDIKNYKVPILIGPTGVGKSEIAFLIAKKIGLEIISADAYQVYRGLPIGTAQPPSSWQIQVPHFLIGNRNPKLTWSAAEFAVEAKQILKTRVQKGKRILIVGGAGFYIKTLVDGLPQGSKTKAEIRNMVQNELDLLGSNKAHQWLERIDPATSKRIHVNDTKRISRALEKALDNSKNVKFEPLHHASVDFYGLEISREHLDDVLKQRVELMWQNGLLEESKGLEHLDLAPSHPIWTAIGYYEALAFTRNELSEKTAKELIFRRTRQYAKRQMTWFKHQHQVEWLNLEKIDKETAVEILSEKINANWSLNEDRSN